MAYSSWIILDFNGASNPRMPWSWRILSTSRALYTLSAHFGAKNEDIGVDNAYFWDINPE